MLPELAFNLIITFLKYDKINHVIIQEMEVKDIDELEIWSYFFRAIIYSLVIK